MNRPFTLHSVGLKGKSSSAWFKSTELKIIMSLNIEIDLPFQVMYSSSQSILSSLRVLEHSKRWLLDPYDLNERKQQTLKLRELWTQVLTECKAKLELNSAVMCMLKAKQHEYSDKLNSLKDELGHTFVRRNPVRIQRSERLRQRRRLVRIYKWWWWWNGADFAATQIKSSWIWEPWQRIAP